MRTAHKERPITRKVIAELELIKKQGRGVLYPEAIVTFAEDKRTALHSKFEWDDGNAGQLYRVWQARQLIKVYVQPIPGTNIVQPVYVSLKKDRYGGDHGGYRVMVDVLSSKKLRQQLLQDAMTDFQYWQQRYYQLQELIPIFETGESVFKKHRLFKKRN